MKFDAVVCGGGAVGIAVARELSFEFDNVLLLEQHPFIGSETSSRNSEVIHAGLYYKTNSLKHFHCMRGQELLYDYLKKNNIKHNKIGKLVVASDRSDQTKLEALYNQAIINEVTDLLWLDRADLIKLEPELNCAQSFLSKNTGIFDSHSFLQAMRFDAEQNGVTFAINHRFVRAIQNNGMIEICLDNMEDDLVFTKRFFNCAGLHAIEVMQNCSLETREHTYRYEYAKGNYFSLLGRSPFQYLIYPIPEQGGLGIHSTLDINGRTKFGPNVEWTGFGVEELNRNYVVDQKLEAQFKSAIERYWPGVRTRTLSADYSGFRPKLFIDDELSTDFVIVKECHGVDCTYMHFLGIESPGLTACLSLAKCITI